MCATAGDVEVDRTDAATVQGLNFGGPQGAGKDPDVVHRTSERCAAPSGAADAPLRFRPALERHPIEDAVRLLDAIHINPAAAAGALEDTRNLMPSVVIHPCTADHGNPVAHDSRGSALMQEESRRAVLEDCGSIGAVRVCLDPDNQGARCTECWGRAADGEISAAET